MSRLFILGAGPAGLGAAISAKDYGVFTEVIIIDRHAKVGGLAQTLKWESFGFHDLGPHKLFSLDGDLVLKIKSFLPADLWLNRTKIARVFQNGTVMNYPPSVIDLAKYFNLKLPKVILEFIIAKLSFWRTSNNLSEAIQNKVGVSLSREIILPAIAKVWGDPTSLDSGLAKSRIQIPTVIEIIKGIFKLGKSSSFQAHQFDYPKGGLSVLWDAIQADCEDSNIKFYLGSSLEQVESLNSQICSLSFSSGEHFELEDDDLVISTLNLDALQSLLGEEKSNIRTTMDLVLVFLHVSEKLNDVSWYFVPDEALQTHRVSSQSAFDPGMVPNGDIICLEYMDRDDTIDNEIILETAKSEFRLIFGQEIVVTSIRAIRLPDSYPKFTAVDLSKNEEKLRKILEFQNLLSIGRHGAAQYVGSLDAFDMGLKTLQWMKSPSSESQLSYRLATNNYPILD
jgi:protoporphyrinogen oxidase